MFRFPDNGGSRPNRKAAFNGIGQLFSGGKIRRQILKNIQDLSALHSFRLSGKRIAPEQTEDLLFVFHEDIRNNAIPEFIPDPERQIRLGVILQSRRRTFFQRMRGNDPQFGSIA